MSNTVDSFINTKKKVVMAVTNDIVTDNRVNRIAKTLIESGLVVTVCGRTFPSGKIKLSRPYKTRRFSLWFNKGPLFYANYNIRLFFYLLFSNYDIIVSNDLDTLAACYLASKIKKSKLVYDSHEYYTEVPELVNRPTVKRIWESIEKRILPDLKYCYTVSQSIAEAYKTKYGTQFKVIRNLPDSNYKTDSSIENTPPFPTNNPIVIYQGAVNLGRGIEEAILSMHLIKNINLVIIGIGDLYEKCRRIVADEKLEDRVFLTGRIEPSILRQFTKLATIGISVEKDMGLNYRFALPNKLFDYIMAGIPVLTSSLPEMKRVVSEYKVGISIEETTPKAIAEGIHKMLSSPDDYIIWKENCLNASQVLCWEKERNILINIFNDVIKER